MSDPLISEANLVGAALKEALDIIAGQSRQRRETARMTLHSTEQAAAWNKACLIATNRTESLITTGSDIIAMVLRECRAAVNTEAANAVTTLPEKLRLAAKELQGSVEQHQYATATVEDHPQSDHPGEALLFEEISRGLRHRALPDLLAACEAGDNSVDIIAALDDLMGGLESRIEETLSGCEDLYQAAVLVEEETSASNAGAIMESEGASLLRALAQAHGERVLGLGKQVKRLGALKASLFQDLQLSTRLYRRAGSAVEDAATAALEGSAILTRLNATAERQAEAAEVGAQVMSGMAAELEEMPPLLQKPADAAASLATAAETLQMATTILHEVARAYGTPNLNEISRQEEISGEAVDTAEELIKQAQVSIGVLLRHLSDGKR